MLKCVCEWVSETEREREQNKWVNGCFTWVLIWNHEHWSLETATIVRFALSWMFNQNLHELLHRTHQRSFFLRTGGNVKSVVFCLFQINECWSNLKVCYVTFILKLHVSVILHIPNLHLLYMTLKIHFFPEYTSLFVFWQKKKGGKEKSTTNHKKNKSNETSDLNSVNVSVWPQSMKTWLLWEFEIEACCRGGSLDMKAYWD